MRKLSPSKTVVAAAASGLLAVSSFSANATVVFVETSMGNFEINLLDEQTPETVANFLKYVESGKFENAIIHRSVDDFVTQTGGYTYDIEEAKIWNIQDFGNVKNEPVYSNVRGTVAMAKLGGWPDSASSEWFVNLNDNSKNLDFQNKGFTVFGVVVGEGMEVVESIANLPSYNAGGAFTQIPLRNDPQPDESIDENHLVLIESVTVTDPNIVTYPELEPPLSTNNSNGSEPPAPTPNDPAPEPTPGNSDSGGSLGWGAALLALFVGLRRKIR